MDLCQIIHQRKSCRAYLDKPVARELMISILETAKWAPSGVNHQPTKVAILEGETKMRLSLELTKKFHLGDPPNPDYDYCPKTWAAHYQDRRKACGFALYNSLKISPDDVQGKKQHRAKNYNFFGAPVGLIIYLDKDMPKGSWIDAGMFIQNLLLAAQSFGLATCPQASFAEYPDIIRAVLALENVDIVCGIAVGYEDPKHPLNSYRTERESIENFTKWYF